MRKKAVQQGRSEQSGESYSVPYVEPLSEATCLAKADSARRGTPLADFFRILLVTTHLSHLTEVFMVW
jgi:hypothetical protein